MDGQAIISVSAAVVALTQIVKWGGLPDKWGPVSVLLLSAAGVVVWSYSQPVPFQNSQLFEYFAGWIAIATSAAGVFGFTRAASASMTQVQAPPGGAGQNPTVKNLLVIAGVSMAMALSACASSQKQKVVVAYQSAETALGQFQDAEIALYNTKTVASLTEEKHKAIHKVLAQAFDAQEKVGSALLIWESGRPAPAGVGAWLTEAERVLAEVRALLPDNDRVRLAQTLIPWIRAILDTVRLFGVQPPPALLQVAEKGVI